MSNKFYHHNYAEYLSTPVSPVPSYQSSSQSSSNSPSGSQSSGAFGDVSTGSPVSPYGPSPWASEVILPPRNPFSEIGSDEVDDLFRANKSKLERYRERSATLRAAALLEETAGADVSDVARIASGPTIVLPKNEIENPILPDLSPAQYTDECAAPKEHLDFLRRSDRARQYLAKQRAVAMLEATVGKQVDPYAELHSTQAMVARTAVHNPSDSQKERKCKENVHGIKKEIDEVLKRGATILSVTSLDKTTNSDERARTAMQKPKSAITARQAAMKNYEEIQRKKAELRAKLQEDKEKHKRQTLRNAHTRMENLAETTRKPRDKRPEDVRDPETVAGMKCQLDIDREMAAKKKALHLMNFGSIA
jgi:hypothetical protein